jgi:glycine dehydrogenase
MVAGDWDHGYDREVAVFPLPQIKLDKYWPPVRRVEGAYGDRNLMCSCPPIESYS